MQNLLLSTDVYKMGHMDQYAPGTQKVYSYLTTRSDKHLSEVVFFGLQYYLMEYLTRTISVADVEEFCELKQEIIGSVGNAREKLLKLQELGYLPLQIKAVPEGTVLPVRNVLMTITNTHSDFGWLVGFMESILLKVWNTCTVASFSRKLKKLSLEFARETCDDENMVRFQVHDFGFRGCSSEETSMLSGMSHLLNFYGTDTIPAIAGLKKYYGAEPPIGLSVPATEHSVMCSFLQENEIDAFRHMLRVYPDGIVSIVSDTYDLWNVLMNFTETLRSDIVNRNGKVVFRPDSGDPQKIVCGDPAAPDGTLERRGALEILWEKFGGTINSKGYRVLDPHVGLIYGDGISYDRFQNILANMKDNGFASSNIVFGIGGLLLQQHSRDELGFAIKATYCEVSNGDGTVSNRELMKDPITDHSKKSHKGLVALHCENGQYSTRDQLSWMEEAGGLLETVFCDGRITKTWNLTDIRARCEF